MRYAGGILPEGVDKLYFVGLIAPRGPQIPVYGEQAARITRMISLHENTENLPLAAYFQKVQTPETRVDVIRHKWNENMAETDAHLRSLESLDTVVSRP